MSSSSATATASRSPSPATPESLDTLEPVEIHHDSEPIWPYDLRPDKSLPDAHAWDSDPAVSYSEVGKGEASRMLCLSDLIDEQAYDDSPVFDSVCSSQAPTEYGGQTSISPIQHPVPQHNSATQILVLSEVQIPPTRPIPPPVPKPRKNEHPTSNQRVIMPPKESCYNMSIITPSIPTGGTKSRVETQVRVILDLAHADSLSSADRFKYDRIGSWGWLKLPPGTATKRRTRKQGKIEPPPDDVLHLTARVTCASPPHNDVVSCSSCRTREAKRFARKLASRVRPTRSDSSSDSSFPPPSPTSKRNQKREDTASIIQFNTSTFLPFSSGSAVLPLRITCYCRHHREKVGFMVHFEVKDAGGGVRGSGIAGPIMITDDHKSTSKGITASGAAGVGEGAGNGGGVEWDLEWLAALESGGNGNSASAHTTRKSMGSTRQVNGNVSKKRGRAKPYDYSGRPSREASVASLGSPRVDAAPVARSPTPPQYFEPEPSSMTTGVEATVPPEVLGGPNIVMSGPAPKAEYPVLQHHQPDRSQTAPSTARPIPQSVVSAPFMFFNPTVQTQPLPALAYPKIHRLIPSTGPTHGGIEVTVLGTNFHSSLTLNCSFGGSLASSTQRWSDNTLVCVLPPRAQAGMVSVWFDGCESDKSGEGEDGPPSLFTYSDESDRALMELALQVVGLKMTGQIEDAKNVAMRIVGTTGESEPSSGGDPNNMMQFSSTPSTRDIRPLFLHRARDNQDFESLIIDFLSVLAVSTPKSSNVPMSDAISYQTLSGQTLLHLASFLGFGNLIGWLITHDVDLDVRDRNGWTPLHFATSTKATWCARLLMEAGADVEIVNVLGKTPAEIAPDGFFGDVSCDEGLADGEDTSQWDEADKDETILSLRRCESQRSLQQIPPLEASVAKGSEKAAEVPLNNEKSISSGIADEKQTSSFVDVIQRTLAQLHAPQNIIPQLPLPHLPLPQFPGMPAVPWSALPQIPMVFPVFVPIPGWPSFKRGYNDADSKDAPQFIGAGAIRTAQDTWEKWVAIATRQQQQETPPPMYTPRASECELPSTHQPQEYDGEDEEEAESSTTPVRPLPVTERTSARRFDYGTVAITDQEMNAYAYRPTKGQNRKLQKKHDRMLILFWIPILLLSLLYAFYNGIQQAFSFLRTAIPLKAGSGLRS